jgi:dihydroorotate dehydrogenase (NAD+) catalytic subunit
MSLDKRLRINGKLPRSRIVTASGCRCTTLETILLYAKTIPEIGAFTTKSIGPVPNYGHHAPIYCAAPESGEYARRNAVGLANPGREVFSEELKKLREKSRNLEGALLIGSVYGADSFDVLLVAGSLAPYVDAIEINFSCPNAKGYGIFSGWDVEGMACVVSAVAKSTGKEVFAKLSPNMADNELANAANACVKAGARGITVINTVGPGDSYLPSRVHGKEVPALFNRKGGLSGPSIIDRGLQCTGIVRRAVGETPLIIGMGGVRTGTDARDYLEAGADFVGIGSVMEGMDSTSLENYISALDKDIELRTDSARGLLQKVNLEYIPVTIEWIERKTDSLRVFYFRERMEGVKPCQYVFLAVPGDDGNPTMEAPFSVPVSEPLTLAVRRNLRGDRKHHFTSRLWEQKKGDTLFVRGPYGVPFDFTPEQHLCLVGGGTGVAALVSIAKQSKHYRLFAGAKTSNELLFIGELNDNAQFATEDGSPKTYHGLVTSLFDKQGDGKMSGIDKVVTCGPVRMMENVVESANRKGFADRDIYAIMEPYMKCGVGICGCCSFPDGSVSCTDGHIITADRLKRFIAAGRVKRDSTGGWEKL